MKKMNNKGFAISTLIYGLSIMGIMLMAILMGTMSSNRNNTKELSQSIEKELISFSKTETSFNPSPTASSQEYLVGEGQSGWYRIELWGAKGAGSGANGAYTTGVISLTEGDILYFNVGKKGTDSSGGQSTDVRVLDGAYNDATSYNYRIMVAAGGGSGTKAVGGTLLGYKSSTVGTDGKLKASSETSEGTEGIFDTTSTLIGVTTSSYAPVDLKITANGQLGPVATNGGGSGYYSSKNGDVGGTSFIAGYAGSGNAILDPEEAGKKYYFIDGIMVPGVNNGDGKAKITKVLDNRENLPGIEPPRINTNLSIVKKIRDCLEVDGSSKNHGETISVDSFQSIIAMKDGNQLAGTLGSALDPDGNKRCRTLTLNTETAVDEIATWHAKKGMDYYNHTIEVQKAGDTTWTLIKKKSGSTSLSETETPTGFHISAFQPDSTKALPKAGNYYIMPVLTENKVISAQQNASDDQNPITASFINGNKTQIWSIELLDDKLRKKKADGSIDTSVREYKVIELARYKAMGIHNDENKAGNAITAATSFNNYARNDPQIWTITPLGNGTYSIKTIVSSFYTASSKQSGYILPNTKQSNRPIMIGKNDLNGQRYRLISLEYMS